VLGVRFKLDENFGNRGAELLRNAGHQVSTVFEQHLNGANDPTVASVCAEEGRCLITMDRDFTNPLLFPPKNYAGIVVLRLSPNPDGKEILDTLRTLLLALNGHESLIGKLWIVRRNRVREYRPPVNSETSESQS
jgi:predicted nuclease of predicted toxin-antitoxin system